MARYQCGICGYIFDEETEGKLFSTLERCPVCGRETENFRPAEENGAEKENGAEPERVSQEERVPDLSYPKEYRRQDGNGYP